MICGTKRGAARITNSTATNTAMARYSRRRKAMAPSWMASMRSRICGVPASRRVTEAARYPA